MTGSLFATATGLQDGVRASRAPASGAETQIWQFGGETNLIRSNKINGQSCDQDYCYVDFPAKIKAAGLNGYAKGSSTPAPVKKSNEEIASEVIAGKWGMARKDRNCSRRRGMTILQSRVS